jgi:hypothetical protein
VSFHILNIYLFLLYFILYFEIKTLYFVIIRDSACHVLEGTVRVSLVLGWTGMEWNRSIPVGTPAYHPGYPLCIQFTIPGDRREST